MIERKQGIVEHLKPDGGFGFIKVEGYEKSIFFHARQVKHVTFEQIRKGDIVSIGNITESERGHVAEDVCLIT